ncbi:MAG: anti-sigma factor [Chloroflexota bacterium]|nr:anti-sigma factor [Chloroflexota bacterium]
MIDGTHIDDDAAAHALGALTTQEAEVVDRHVKDCRPCQEKLADAHETAHMLAFVAPPLQPPARCKARLMEAIERESFLRSRTSRRSLGGNWARWATVVAVLALVVWNMRLQQEVGRARTIEDMVMSDPDPKTLRPGPDVRGSHGRIFVKPDGQHALLVIENLKPAPAGKVYQVWVADERRQHSMKTFQVADQREELMMEASVPLTTFKWIMVTEEDAPGSTKPSKKQVLFGDL